MSSASVDQPGLSAHHIPRRLTFSRGITISFVNRSMNLIEKQQNLQISYHSIFEKHNMNRFLKDVSLIHFTYDATFVLLVMS